ncbi:hypothetical protein FHS61_001837 [Altererythrobacter atlanticus]|uniref:Uncharacterized protein n=1 Tax=Croceibacterium atlanticum TaxID=1267766 RepID=A0A0F7KR75_9SPHN|nr:hypothetical protein [Croceibacterium atlanticum]AKH41310.1 hypothetical protein WYH_00246 [Croceibacterium atlanticum]MBB5732828.1 hypothetical protein [Croceibacterium atlanticum]
MAAMPNSQLATSRRALFVLTILTGSFLLFLVQPMVARFALPVLGGAPNVWNSAMLVFQTLLLGGYLYAHLLTRFSLRKQAGIHLALLLLAALTLPIALAELPPPRPGLEAIWVPALFLATIGPIFLLLSAQASLMQRWFAASPAADNPYALYAASNIGSFAGLLAYPFLLELTLPLGAQSMVWSALYALLILFVALAALARWNSPETAANAGTEGGLGGLGDWPPARRLILWLALSAVPSGLILSTTTLLTTDIMAAPLLWILPLGVYLLSFAFAFSEESELAQVLIRFAPVSLLFISSLAMATGGQSNVAAAFAMVGLLFVLSVALHSRLYDLRPAVNQLTLFYLVLAAGGALGGLFAALIAPLIFDWIYEHAILLLAAAMLLRQQAFIPPLARYWQEGGPARHLIASALVICAGLIAWRLDGISPDASVERLLHICAMAALGIALIGLRWAYIAVICLIMLGNTGLTTLESSLQGKRARSYFGAYSVDDVNGGTMRRLAQGTTIHGRQWLLPERRREPTSYYGHSSGVGIALDHAAADARIGVVGLGAGTLACYRKPGQDWTFYEIDALVLRYSRDGTFTFLRDCAPGARILIGDARLKLEQQAPGRLDILALDAFSSDSIPIHLLTREAFGIYGRALSSDGLLLVHISNRYFDLRPMIAALAGEGGWHAAQRMDVDDLAEGTTASLWIALSRDEETLAALRVASSYEWKTLPRPAPRAWTDDNSSILPLIRW